jgi:hypothetical protein
MKITGLAALAGSVVLGAAVSTGCGTAAATPKAAPTVTVTRTHTRIVPARPTKSPASSPAAAPAAPAPAANAVAVVDQFYQDITNHDYAAAWTLGGVNVSSGVGYSQWVAGYATTASIAIGTSSEFNATTVNAEIIATENDGGVHTYQGTYTVINGVITAASIAQAS